MKSQPAYNTITSLLAAAVFFAAYLLMAPTAYAITSIAGTVNATSSVNAATPITGISIVGNAASTTPVKLVVAEGTLSITNTGGLSALSGTTGSTITFTATVANANAALATLTYTRGVVGTTTLEISLVGANEVFFPGNGHLYQYIPSNGDWGNAQTAAAALTRYGATGYLTTITSAAENNFVAARLDDAGWMGAADTAVEGDWRWVTGPESGTQFWSGDGSGGTVGGNYANWEPPIEPNDSGGDEDCAQFLSGGTGLWNDLPCSGFDLPGYVAEFGAPGNLPSVIAKNISLVTITPPTVSTFVPADNATNINGTTNLSLTFSEAVTAGTGTISIYQTSGDVLIESIPVASSRVIGGGTATITIDPSTTLADTTAYYVRVGAQAFENMGRAFYAGISSATTWNFATGDYTGPVITAVASSPSSATAAVTWTTNELASSRVVFGTNGLLTQTTSEVNTSPRVTSHSVTLTGLSSCTTYSYQVVSIDGSVNNNTATSSVQTFTTTGCSSSGGTSVPARVSSLERTGNLTQADTLREQYPQLFTTPSTPATELQALQATFARLLAQLMALRGEDYTPGATVRSGGATTTPALVPVTTISGVVRDLYRGLEGDDVRALQALLINHDAGPKARELKRVTATGFFASYTEEALIEYQNKYGIMPAAGYFGPATRAQMTTVGLPGLWW